MSAAGAYYNEIDPYAAQWLRNLITAGHIAAGDVDERSIVDVRAVDIRGYIQAHFFAGIGGWSYALRLAGWDDARPVWTGSCPCQPFSCAGQGKAADDIRHMWPAWFPLIAECRPPTVFGEQVEAAIGWGCLDTVFADLEGAGYACGAAVLPACGVGAPHIRQRLWFVADADRSGSIFKRITRLSPDGNASLRDDVDGCGPDGLADTAIAGRRKQPQRTAGADGREEAEPRRLRDAGELADNGGAGLEIDGFEPAWNQRATVERSGAAGELGDAEHRTFGEPGQLEEPQGKRVREVSGKGTRVRLAGNSSAINPWRDCDWLPCTDGKARPTQPGIFPLAHGVSARVAKLRAAGNAIVPQLAAEFIGAFMECRP